VGDAKKSNTIKKCIDCYFQFSYDVPKGIGVEAMPFCPDCGTQVSEETQFCPECGHPLAIGQPARGTSKKKIAGIVVACIVAIILVAVLARPASPPVIETPPLEEGWIRLRIENVGSIDYPSDFLELQSGDYREFTEEFGVVYDIPSSDFTLQQVGLNELKPSAFEEYRRVLFQTSYLNPGEEVFRANEKYAMSQQELAQIHNELIDQLNQEYAKLKSMELGDNKIIGPGSVEIVEINGMFPLVHTYKRQLNDNPVVSVKLYIFWNYSKIHHLLFSHRVVNEEECRDIYAKVLYSFRLQ